MDFRSQPTVSYQLFQNSEETCPPRQHRWGAAHSDSSSLNAQTAKPSAVNREILFSDIPARNPSTSSARVNLFSRSLSIFFFTSNQAHSDGQKHREASHLKLIALRTWEA